MTGPVAMKRKYSLEQSQAVSDAETQTEGYAAPLIRWATSKSRLKKVMPTGYELPNAVKTRRNSE